MPSTLCVVNGCKNSVNDKYLWCTDTLFRFPVDETRAREWVIACNREDLLDQCHKLPFLSLRVCSLHFDPTSFTSDLRNRLRSGSIPTIFPENVELSNNSEEHIIEDNEESTILNPQYGDVTVSHIDEEPNFPTVFLISNDTDPVFQNQLKIEIIDKPEAYKKCRTCLSLTTETACRSITETCYLNKSVMDAIILLVPQMVLTLKDSDVVCNDCFKILASATEFISRCLEIEEILTNVKVEDALYQQNIALVENPQSVTTPKTEDIGMIVDSEHDYCIETESVNDVASSNTSAVESPPLLETVFIKETRSDTRNAGSKSSKRLNSANPKPRVRKPYKKKVVEKSEVESEDEGPFSCTPCSEDFESKEAYEAHVEVHLPYICDVCGKSYPKKDSLRAHKITHNDPNTCICEICGRGTKDPLSLKRHLETHTKTEKSMVCEKCAKMFRNKALLTHHIKHVHNGDFTVQCPHCGMMLCSPNVLKQHINVVHLKMKPHKCNYCEKRFGRRDYLRQHLELHTDKTGIPRTRGGPRVRKRTKVIVNEKYGLVPCKFCGKVIEGKAKLETHLSVHINRHKCSKCPRSFNTKWSRDEHEAIHDKEVFFRCNACYRKFKTKEELEAHAATQIHRRPPRYKCDTCGQKFHRRYTLSQHILTDHVIGSEDKTLDKLVYEEVLQNNDHTSKDNVDHKEDKNSGEPILPIGEEEVEV